MNIIRLSINNAPEQIIKIMSKINSQDRQISKLFKKFLSKIIMSNSKVLLFGDSILNCSQLPKNSRLIT